MNALRPRSVWSVCYWTLVALTVMVGLGGAFTIGIPFLIVGWALIVLSPFRRQPAVFWPLIIALLTFMGGLTLVSPVSCRTSEPSEASVTSVASVASVASITSVATVVAPSQAVPLTPASASPATRVTSMTGEGSTRTSCTNLVGIDYSWLGNYRLTLLPTLLVVLLAAFLGFVSRARLRRREARSP